MKLVHYSDRPLDKPYVRNQGDRLFKPNGLWLSDDDCANNWRSWCITEDFRLERLTHVHDVELAANANVLILRTIGEVNAFSAEFRDTESGIYWLRYYTLHWHLVRERYAGLIITPYLWHYRLWSTSGWYHTWDCASGCIWDPTAIASIRLREVVPVPRMRNKYDMDKQELISRSHELGMHEDNVFHIECPACVEHAVSGFLAECAEILRMVGKANDVDEFIRFNRSFPQDHLAWLMHEEPVYVVADYLGIPTRGVEYAENNPKFQVIEQAAAPLRRQRCDEAMVQLAQRTSS